MVLGAINLSVLIVVVGALVVLGLVVVMYGLAPLQILRKQSHKIDPPRERVELAQLPTDVARQIADAQLVLGEQGFTTAAILRSHSVPNVIGHVALMTHPQLPDVAQVMVMETIPPASGLVPRRVIRTVVLEREFASGESVVTGNSRDAGIFPRDPTRHALSAPQVQDLRLLGRMHQARVARESGAIRGAPMRWPAGGEAERHVEKNRREMRRVANAGYYRIDEAAGVYRPTVKGAYMMTWKMLPPFKNMRRRAKERRTEAELRQLFANSVVSQPRAAAA